VLYGNSIAGKPLDKVAGESIV